jgi:VWFA-related protein
LERHTPVDCRADKKESVAIIQIFNNLYQLEGAVMTFANRASFALMCLALFCASPGLVFAQNQSESAKQEQDAPIKLGSTLVSVPVIVSDRNGRYVSGLKAENFTLYKDGVKQQISFFTAEEEPIHVALLLDTSKSTRNVLDEIKGHARNFLKQLRPQDQAMVVSFDYEVHVLTGLTAERRVLERAIHQAEIGEYVGTTLRDAVYEVEDRHFKKIKGRKAIILLTDGKDHGSRISTDELLEASAESDAMIYTVFYTTKNPNLDPRFDPFPRRRRDEMDPPVNRGRRRFPLANELLTSRQRQFPGRAQRRQRIERQNERAEQFLEELANVSAGRFYRSEVADLKKNFELIADELRHQYRIGFYPDGEKREGVTHKLRVEVSRPDAVVRARRSYTD